MRIGRCRNGSSLAVVVALVLAAAAALAGCGSSDSGSSTAADRGQGSSEGDPLHFIFVSSDPSSQETGAIIDNGMSAAADELGVDAEYRSTKALEFTPIELKRLLEDAIAAKPDGLIVTDTEPKSLNPTIAAAAEAGIPVVIANTGLGQTRATKALTYVGNDETASGRLGGEKLAAAGASHALLITLPPGVPLVEEREEGFEEGFGGEVTKLAIREFNDTTAATNAVLASLQKDSSIDAVFALGSALSPAELAAEKQLGDGAGGLEWATIDIGSQVLQAIEAGQMSFALDQQPYLEGYLPVLYLKQYLELGLSPVQEQVPTGPALVDRENAAEILELSGKQLR